MNITYIIGVVVAILFMLFGMVFSGGVLNLKQITHFGDPQSVLIVVGCTVAIIVASFPVKMITSMPKHFGIMLNTKKFNPMYYIDQLVELAQVARKNGLLALEEKANAQGDPFFRQAIMLVVDANDPDKVRSILNNDIECMSARHEGVCGMYDRGSAISPAFGMIGTLIGLILMLRNLNFDDGGGAETIGSGMAVALITTLYGCILAHMIFTPISSNLRARDEEEVLCKLIIVEGIMSIQSGENPKFLKEKLLTFMAQKQRDSAIGNAGGEGEGEGAAKGKKKKK